MHISQFAVNCAKTDQHQGTHVQGSTNAQARL